MDECENIYFDYKKPQLYKIASISSSVLETLVVYNSDFELRYNFQKILCKWAVAIVADPTVAVAILEYNNNFCNCAYKKSDDTGKVGFLTKASKNGRQLQ